MERILDGNGGHNVALVEGLVWSDQHCTGNCHETDILPLAIDGGTIVFEDVELSGAFSPAADAIAGVRLVGTLDTQSLAELVGDDPCGLLAVFGLVCQECSDGSGPPCLHVEIDSMQAELVEGLTVVERLPQCIDVDPMCGATGTPTLPPECTP